MNGTFHPVWIAIRSAQGGMQAGQISFELKLWHVVVFGAVVWLICKIIKAFD